jgi:hypothetical protein
VVAEAESVTVFLAYRDATTDPAVKRALAELLRDEVRHVAAGEALRALLEEMLPAEEQDAVRARLAAVESEDRRYLRDIYRAAANGGPGRAFGATIEVEDLVRAKPAAYPVQRPSSGPRGTTE